MNEKIISAALSLLLITACQPATEDLVASETSAYRSGPTNVFLSAKGLGNLQESNAYLTAVGANPLTYTLAEWKRTNLGAAPVVTSLYQNLTELGFWREMTCSRGIGRGAGGCAVTNWTAPNEPARGVANQGTVAMTLSREGVVQFYVFLPDGKISPTAILDQEGPKFAPRLCIVCHSGNASNPGVKTDFGSIFREFDPSALREPPGVPRAEAEAEWRALNRVAQDANRLVRGEAEGAPAGTDHARESLIDRINVVYLSGTEPVPDSWSADGAVTVNLWKGLVAPYCMACHRHNALDFRLYPRFQFLKRQANLAKYLPFGPPSDTQAMPQAARSFDLLSRDTVAKAAVDAWLRGPACVAGQPCSLSQLAESGLTRR